MKLAAGIDRDLSVSGGDFASAAGRSSPSLFLDFDGTLTPVTGHPGDAVLSDESSRTLAELATLYPVAIVSGREIGDIRKRAPVEGIAYAGNHGMEIWSADFTMTFDIGRGSRRELDEISRRLEALASDERGTVLESKGFSLSLHYKCLAAGEEAGFIRRLKATMEPYISSREIRITGGKKVYEVRSGSLWHKGSALRWIMQRRGFTETLPIYFGDDDTDRDAFREIKGYGISVFVGGDDDEADFFLHSPGEVNSLLRAMIDAKAAPERARP